MKEMISIILSNCKEELLEKSFVGLRMNKFAVLIKI